MEMPEMQAVLTRLESLERENLKLKIAAAVLLAAMLALWALAAYRTRTMSQQIESKRFVVTDEQGRQRATLGTNGYDVDLILSDGSGEPLAVMSVMGKQGARISLGNYDRVGLNLSVEAGSADVELWRNGHEQAQLTDNGLFSSLQLGEAGSDEADLTVAADGKSWLAFFRRGAKSPFWAAP